MTDKITIFYISESAIIEKGSVVFLFLNTDLSPRYLYTCMWYY